MNRPLLCLAALLIAAWSHAAETRKPNILIILADDLGWGELGFQGNTSIPTPHIDSIARHGVRFTSGYVSGPYCSPTRAGLLTGRYQQRFGHEFNPGPAPKDDVGLPLSERTLADRLREAGYATGMFGKWHLGGASKYHPLQRGFEEYFGFLGGAHPYLSIGQGANAVLRGTEPVPELDFTTAAFAREAAKFIGAHAEKPWFVYLPFNAVHGPMEAPAEYLAKFAGIPDQKRRTYAAMESALDDAVGVVLAKLAELKLEENTLVFFFTDNGGPTAVNTSSNAPLSGFKAQVWEGGVRVPFAMQWKGRLPAGQAYEHPIIQLDIFPTALAAAGLSAPAEAKLDGANLLPYLTGENKAAPHPSLFWRFGRQRAVRAGDWKLVDTGDGAHLFNLTTDISEQKNLATEQPEKLKQLEDAYAEWNRANIPPKWGPAAKAGRPAGDAPRRQQRRLQRQKGQSPATPAPAAPAQG